MLEKIEILKGDITKLKVDVIVNAANTTLLGGGGVDGAIHRAAGPKLLEECRQLNGCLTGDAKITKGYNLPASYVIHTVGPVWNGGTRNEAEKLSSCYKKCFELSKKHNLKTIAFPSISTGAYGYPVEEASKIALNETRNYLEKESHIEKVVFVCFDDKVYNTYLNNIKEVFS